MSEHPQTRQDATPQSPHERPPGHEREIDRDINLRGVAITVLAIFLLTVVSMVAMWVMFEVFLQTEIARDPQPSPIPEAAQQTAPPAPRLQESPELELEQFRARENAQLSSYSWRDREAGVVSIPISRAMDLMVSQGREAMATTPDPVADATGGDAGAATPTTDEGTTDEGPTE